MILRFEVGLTVPFTNCVDRQSRCSDASRAVPGAPSTNSPTSPSCISIVAPLQVGHRQTHALPRLFTPADDCYQPSHTSWIVRTETSESVDLISRLVTPTKILCRIQDVPGQEEVVMCQICRIIEGLALRWYCAEGEPRLQLQVASRRFGIVPPCLRRFGHVVLGRVVASDKWA